MNNWFVKVFGTFVAVVLVGLVVVIAVALTTKLITLMF